MAFTEKEKGSGAIVTVFMGDGTLGQGVVYESFNIASLWKLPMLFVIEANGYAQTTPTSMAMSGSLIDRPRAFGIETREMNVTDPECVHTFAKKMVETIRKEVRPISLVLRTYRLGPHSKGDDHRPREEVEQAAAKDPLNILLKSLPSDLVERAEKEIQNLIDAKVERIIQERPLPESEFAKIVYP
jgi:TPP-dependent pyruvate/acetoin dehydrogenase alpha subunit